ncbi:MAG: hypothetical protein AAF639_47010 [Chloroflexota bacterium]
MTKNIDPIQLQKIAEAIQQVQHEIRWKSDSAIRHLNTRKKRGHLATDAALSDYHQLIKKIVTTLDADVYLFQYSEDYPTVVTFLEEAHWLVMFSMDGIMETAFVVERPNAYLNKPNVIYLGKLQELLS